MQDSLIGKSMVAKGFLKFFGTEKMEKSTAALFTGRDDIAENSYSRNAYIDHRSCLALNITP